MKASVLELLDRIEADPKPWVVVRNVWQQLAVGGSASLLLPRLLLEMAILRAET
jgi:hypothetical protein